jgi:hypothetical protein
MLKLLYELLRPGRLLMTSREKSARIAIGGVFSALCLLLMFLSSVIPFAAIALPMLAGAMLTVVMLENGAKTAFLVYISVSLLSLFIVPNIDAKLLFILFFGYYSILKPAVEKIPVRAAQMALKLFIFNATMVSGYYFSIVILGLSDTGNELFEKYAPAFLLVGMNLSFILYDYLLTRYIFLYIHKFKPTFLRR